MVSIRLFTELNRLIKINTSKSIEIAKNYGLINAISKMLARLQHYEQGKKSQSLSKLAAG